MRQATALKAVPAVVVDLLEVLGGPVEKLTAAQFSEGLARLEVLASEAAKRFSAAEAEIKTEAVKGLGSEQGAVRLAELRARAAPLQAERDRLTDWLDGARTVLAEKLRAERDHAINTARQALEKELAKREAVAKRIDDRIHDLAADLQELNALGEGALHAARAKLTDENARGFRLSGMTGQGFRPETAQHEVNLCLAWIAVRHWRYDRMPDVRAIPGFGQLTANWHAELLSNFEERYERAHPGLTEGAEQ